MKTSGKHVIGAAVVFLSLVVAGCSHSPTSPNSGSQYGNTSNGYFTITQPAHGDSVLLNSTLPVAWTSLTAMTDSFVTVSLYKGDTLVHVYNPAHGNTGADTVTISSAYAGSGTDYHLRIASASDPTKYDMSYYFTVYSGYSGTFTITSPAADSSWMRGTSDSILWTYTGMPGAVNIQLYNDADLVSQIATDVVNSGNYYGLIPANLGSGNKYRIKITSYYDMGISAYSDYFTIVSGYSGAYTIISPAADSSWSQGARYYVQWTDTGNLGATTSISLYNDTTRVTAPITVNTGAGSYLIRIPATLADGNSYRIRLSSTADVGLYAYSDYFTIHALGPDAYEYDGSTDSAKTITTDGTVQSRTLTANDADWVKFNAVSGTTYTIQTFGNVNTVLDLYNGTTLIAADNNSGTPPANALIMWPCTATGTYYFEITGVNVNTGVGSYTVSVTAQ